MSNDDLKSLFIRAILDPDFRSKLIDNQGQEISDFNLSEEEIIGLKEIDLEEFSRVCAELQKAIKKNLTFYETYPLLFI
jgi:hypothetical protein